jgi:hypothetical protein
VSVLNLAGRMKLLIMCQGLAHSVADARLPTAFTPAFQAAGRRACWRPRAAPVASLPPLLFTPCEVGWLPPRDLVAGFSSKDGRKERAVPSRYLGTNCCCLCSFLRRHCAAMTDLTSSCWRPSCQGFRNLTSSSQPEATSTYPIPLDALNSISASHVDVIGE